MYGGTNDDGNTMDYDYGNAYSDLVGSTGTPDGSGWKQGDNDGQDGDSQIQNQNKERTDSAVYKVSFEEWYVKLIQHYENLQDIVDRNLPNLWHSLEFDLSILRILNIKECSLPFAGIVLGPPSSLKTVGLQLFRKAPHTFYTDNFSARSFVSHNTGISKDKLKEIDLLPKIKNKCFLTPELAPTFAAKDEDLIQTVMDMRAILVHMDIEAIMKISCLHG
jgi:hypothetical protein